MRLQTPDGGLSPRQIFQLKNDLSDAEYEYLMLRKSIGQITLGKVKFPNGELKEVKK